jgi:hypothetical protein
MMNGTLLNFLSSDMTVAITGNRMAGFTGSFLRERKEYMGSTEKITEKIKDAVYSQKNTETGFFRIERSFL